LKQETRPKEPLSIPGAIVMPYRYAAGDTASRFFIELRDNTRIMGTRCAQCNHVYVPPRATCVHCFGTLDEWVELDGRGTVQSYTTVQYALPVHPLDPPFVYGIILLDGATTGLTHFLGEVESEKLKIGMRVKPVFKEQREGNILDIKYFKPI
jgi:uncharacterized OB-fold protein